MDERRGLAAGGPADGQELSSPSRYVEVPVANAAYDPDTHGLGVDELGLLVDGRGNRPWIRVRYAWDRGRWRPAPERT